MPSAVGPRTVRVDCCYCLATQWVPRPPCLHRCFKCERDFRVLLDERGWTRLGDQMELSHEARYHFSDKEPA